MARATGAGVVFAGALLLLALGFANRGIYVDDLRYGRVHREIGVETAEE